MTKEEAKGNLIHAFRWNDMPKKEALEIAIKALEQEPKTGHWIYKRIRDEKVPCCSRCGLDNGTYYKFNFCPNCGAQMIEPQKRSDKE